MKTIDTHSMNESHVVDAERIARICYETYNSLPKAGKSVGNEEWTVLSCILSFNKATDVLHVVALGTGEDEKKLLFMNEVRLL